MRKTISMCTVDPDPAGAFLFLGTNGFHARIQEIEKEIGGTWLEIVEARLGLAGRMEDPEEAQAERDDVQPSQSGRRERFNSPSSCWSTSKENGEYSKNRVVGHIVLSPPLIHGAGPRFHAVIEVDTNKIDATNFIGNAIRPRQEPYCLDAP
jgi:hypothetical protein